MKLRIVGGPVEAGKKVEVEVNGDATDWVKSIEAACGSSLAGYNIHGTEIDGKKVKAGALLNSGAGSTPASNELKNGAILMLKAKGGSNPTTPRDPAPPAAAAPPPAAEPAAPAERSYKDRVVAIFEAYDPGKVGQAGALLEKHKGKEEQVISSLVKKYGPEPAPKAATPRPAAPPPPAPAPEKPAGSPVAPTVPKLDIPSTAPPPKTYKERITALFEKYDPAKLSQVDALLKKYQGKEEQAIAQLVKKMGPEPDPNASFSSAAGSSSAQPTPHSVASESPASQRSEAQKESTPIASPRSYKDRVIAIFNHYDPGKVGQAAALLDKHKGKEEQVISSLVKKYGPEPDPMAGGVAPPTPRKSYRDRVIAMYTKYAPEKLSTVDRTMEKFKGQEEEVMKTLIGKYGPEPVDEPPAPTPAAPAPAPAPVKAAPPAPAPAPEPPARSKTPPATTATPPPAPQPKATAAHSQPPAPHPVEEAHQPAAKQHAEPPKPPTPQVEKISQEPTPVSTPRDEAESSVITSPIPSPVASQHNTVAPVAAHHVVPPVPMPPLKPPRSRGKVLEFAMTALAQSVAAPLRKRVFASWKRFAERSALTKLAHGALERHEWVQDEQGFHSAEGGETVPDLEAEFMRRKRNPSLAPSLCADLRTLAEVVQNPLSKTCHITAAEASTVCLGAIHQIRRLRTELSGARNEILARENETRGQIHHLEAELEQALQKISQADAKMSQFSQLQDELKLARQQVEEVKEAGKAGEAKTKALKEQVAKLKKELENERKGIPTDLEQQMAARDETIAKMHQELAKLRLQVKQLKTEKSAAIEEAEKVKQLRARSAERESRRQRSPSPQATYLLEAGPTAGSPPHYMIPAQGSRPRFAGAANQSGDGGRPISTSTRAAPRQGSGNAQGLVDDSSEFLPDEAGSKQGQGPSAPRAIKARDVDEQSNSTVDDDEVILQPLPDRGSCPHCHTGLTSFNNEDLAQLADEAKAAFCFSCRRSFLARDLRARDSRAVSRDQILAKYASPNPHNPQRPSR
jgi:hypothetical protein